MRNLGYGKNLMNFFFNSVASAFPVACCGEIKLVAVGPRIRIYDETYRLLQKEKRKST